MIVKNKYAQYQVPEIKIPNPQNPNEPPLNIEQNQTTDDLLATTQNTAEDANYRLVDNGMSPERCRCCKARLKDFFSSLENLLCSDFSIDESKLKNLFDTRAQIANSDNLQL